MGLGVVYHEIHHQTLSDPQPEEEPPIAEERVEYIYSKLYSGNKYTSRNKKPTTNQMWRSPNGEQIRGKQAEGDHCMGVI